MRASVLSALAAVVVSGAMSSVSAADLPVRMPVKAPVAVVADTWTGFYVGAIGGYANASSHVDPTGILPLLNAYSVDFTVDGGFAGGQIGYDHQFRNGVVLGVVGDMSWANLRGTTCVEVTANRCTGAPRDSYAIGTIKWIATARGKLGYAIGPQGLIYATGGVAFIRTTAEDTFIDGTNNITAESTRTGWVVGAGAQYKFTRNVSLGFEYLHADFGTENVVFSSSHLNSPLTNQPISIDSGVKLDIFKGALNVHF